MSLNWRASTVLALTVVWCTPLVAAPYVPTDDAQVLQQLRKGPTDPSLREARQLRAELARDPTNVDKAVETARRYIQQARAEADPRFFGYAQAALGPWWNLPDPPSDVLFLRSTLRQAAHDFVPALNDLARLLKAQPSNLEAYLQRAIIYQVMARYDDAKRDCQAWAQAARRYPQLQLTAVTCLASVASFNGEAKPALETLQQAVERSRLSGASDEDRQWAYTSMADIAARTGQPKAAEQYFKQALELGRNAWLTGTYADFLLDQNRFADVIALLKGETDADTLLLLLTLAEQQINAPELGKHIEMLSERYAAMRSRNDMRHLREEARFTLHLLNEPKAALKLALDNWAVQHEPEDARIVLAAALAAKDYAAARPVLDFLQEKHTEDLVLERMSQQLHVQLGSSPSASSIPVAPAPPSLAPAAPVMDPDPDAL